MQEAEHGDRHLQSKTSGDRRVEEQLELPRKTLRPEKTLRRKMEKGSYLSFCEMVFLVTQQTCVCVCVPNPKDYVMLSFRKD